MLFLLKPDRNNARVISITSFLFKFVSGPLFSSLDINYEFGIEVYFRLYTR